MRSYLDDDSSHYLIKEKVETIVKHITACIAKIDVSEFDFRIGKCQTIDSVRSILCLINTILELIAQNALQREWGNFPFANWNGICWGLQLRLVQLIKIHFLPHLESFMCKHNFWKQIFINCTSCNGSPQQIPFQFANGKFPHSRCRAFWARTVSFLF